MAVGFTFEIRVKGKGPPGFAATITHAGVSTTYSSEGAEDMGAYTDPVGAFVQHCYRAPRQDAALPGFTVWFRVDADGSRSEIVFEHGLPLIDTLTPWNLGAYTADIHMDGVLLASINVPYHQWFSRWRWQSAPRPVRKTAREIIDSGLVPHIDPTVLGAFTKDYAACTYTPMGFAGMCTSMGGTGDRADIGPITGWQGQWLCRENNTSTVLAQGEASGTIPMHIRDPETGGPLDLAIKYPNGSTGGSYANPIIKLGKDIQVFYDSGHSPCPAYLPWLMTGDPYFLEALQFQANFEIVTKQPSYRYTDAGRYGAWTLRNKLYAEKSTPASVPTWLLPRGNFKHHMNKVRDDVLLDMASTDVILSVFRCRSYGGSQSSPPHPSGTYCSLWQDAMETTVYGLCVQLGFPEWLDQLRWKADSEIRRCEGSDWRRCVPAPYSVGLSYTTNLTAAMTVTDTTIAVDSYGTPPWPDCPFDIKIDSETMSVTSTGVAWDELLSLLWLRLGRSEPEALLRVLFDVLSGRTLGWTVARTKPVAHNTARAVLGPKFTSWAEANARIVAAYPQDVPSMPDDPTGMTMLYSNNHSSSNWYVRAALATAVRNGIDEAQPAYDWIHSEFERLTSSQWNQPFHWMAT